jgi:hypothetical protein
MSTTETRREARAARKRAELVKEVKGLQDVWFFLQCELGLLDVHVTVDPGIEDSTIEAADDRVLLDVVLAANDAANALRGFDDALDRLVNPDPEVEGEDAEGVIE